MRWGIKRLLMHTEKHTMQYCTKIEHTSTGFCGDFSAFYRFAAISMSYNYIISCSVRQWMPISSIFRIVKWDCSKPQRSLLGKNPITDLAKCCTQKTTSDTHQTIDFFFFFQKCNSWYDLPLFGFSLLFFGIFLSTMSIYLGCYVCSVLSTAQIQLHMITKTNEKLFQ